MASQGGVSASCEFEGYDTDGYTVLLYLNQLNEDGTVSERVRKWVKHTDSGSGTGSTDADAVETGIYRATVAVSRKDGESSPVTDFKDSIWYDVVRGEDGYTVTPHKEPSGEEQDTPQGPPQEQPDEPSEDTWQKPTGGSEPGGAGEPSSAEKWDVPSESGRYIPASGEYSGCDHSLGHYVVAYRIVQEANTDSDALLAGECARCGEILSYSYVPNSAYRAFLAQTVQTITDAQEEEVTIVTDRWESFDRTVFEAMAQRPEVAVTVRYRYEGKDYTVTIPAGAASDSLTDENGFCGFRYLDQVFGGEEIAQ